MTKQGFFISIEGVEGVGKTTAIQFLQKHFDRAGIPCVLTREPGGTPIAEDIREVLLKNYHETMCADTELLLMFAGRAQNIAEVILPALERGKCVISDRFTDASFAYQGGGRGIALKHITNLAKWVQGDLQPDLTLLLDAPVALGFERLQSRGAKDRIESEGIEFFERVRAQYLEQAKTDPKRFRVIDASKPLPVVQQALLAAVDPLIKRVK